MKRTSVENVMRCMLAAWTLCMPVFAAPTVVHSHSGGDRHHEHGQADCLPHTVSHGTSPESLARRDGGETHLPAADLHQHRCFSLLGSVKYLPMPSAPVSAHGALPCVWETAIVAVSHAPALRPCSNGAVGGHC